MISIHKTSEHFQKFLACLARVFQSNIKKAYTRRHSDLMVICLNRNASEDVWLGLIKHPNSSLWYQSRKFHCVEANISLPGQLFHERQCAVLNMSSDTKSNILYADQCAGNAFGFACLGHYGTVPDGKLNILCIMPIVIMKV